MSDVHEAFALQPGTRWLNIATGKGATIVRILPDFAGRALTFRKDSSGTATVSEAQFLSMYRPDLDPLTFPTDLGTPHET